MQTWTLRNLTFEQSVEFCAKHGIKYLQLIPDHLNMNGTREEWKKKKEFNSESENGAPYLFTPYFPLRQLLHTKKVVVIAISYDNFF